MVKAKKGSSENPITTKELEAILTTKPIEIISASLKDGLCNYSYELKTGVNIGDTHNVKGKGIIMDDLSNAFVAFNVHLAIIDEIFKNSSVEFDAIDEIKNDDLVFQFNVTGFKMKISGDVESIYLTGTKYVSSAGGYLDINTHKIDLTQYSSYKWFADLKEAADCARLEVELYKDGKCTPVEQEEPVKNPKQMSILDKGDDGDDNIDNGDKDLDDDFKNATV